MLVDLSGRIW